ncbi:hypothetical protein ACI78T_13680 [Blastococcus sp. SYSU D00922]
MARGLRQALLMVTGGVAVSVAAGGLWWWLGDSGFRRSTAICLMVVAGLLALTGGTALSRASTSDVRAFLGWGLDDEEPDSGEGLTAVGVFLFVCLPLLAAGLALDASA